LPFGPDLNQSPGIGATVPSVSQEDAMSYARQMLDSYRHVVNVDPGMLDATVDALNGCAQACAADVDADLSEQNLAEMVRCIRLCLQCTDLCTATVDIVRGPPRRR
jgi:hypothetical protein